MFYSQFNKVKRSFILISTLSKMFHVSVTTYAVRSGFHNLLKIWLIKLLLKSSEKVILNRIHKRGHCYCALVMFIDGVQKYEEMIKCLFA